jgi:hypothetical protein
MNDRNMDNWMDEYGIPHDNGKIKWYILAYQEDGGHYLGEYDMTDWDKGWDIMFADALKCVDKFIAEDGSWQVCRHDQVLDMMWGVFNALEQSKSLNSTWIDLDEYKEDWEIENE